MGPSALTRHYLVHSDGTTNGRIAEFLHIAHAQVPVKGKRNTLQHDAEARYAGLSSKDQSDRFPKVTVPDDIQALLDSHSHHLKRKDFTAMMENYSDKYLSNGRTKQEMVILLHRIYQGRTIHNHKIILTQFEPKGDAAKIDGYVLRKGYRTPLMITDIVKEDDGRWRWYGNQR